MEKDRITCSIQENRCFICGTEHGKQIKVLENVYLIDITVSMNLIPICNLCLAYYPPNNIAITMDLVHLSWMILEKRLQQQQVYSKICKNDCGTPIVTARKEKEFCSNNCRAKYWQKQKNLP
mgnify:FL=1